MDLVVIRAGVVSACRDSSRALVFQLCILHGRKRTQRWTIIAAGFLLHLMTHHSPAQVVGLKCLMKANPSDPLTV